MFEQFGSPRRKDRYVGAATGVLHAERDGVVAKIYFEAGTTLAVDDKILELE